MLRSNFAAFILTHGRADHVRTYHTLRKCGYSGRIYLLVDDEDKQLPRYLELYKDEVIVFPKQDAIRITDAGSNFGKYNSVVFARNYNFIVAKQLGLKYFWQLDDDYKRFMWSLDTQGNYLTTNTSLCCLDKVIPLCLDFLDESGAASIAFSQGGDFLGGDSCGLIKKYRKGLFYRKVMNSFFFRTDYPVHFRGILNDDVNMYVGEGIRGKLFITLPCLRLEQARTQQQSGGLTDIYLDCGTYMKSFSSVMIAPTCVKISTIGNVNPRIHHQIQWNNACPVIVDEKYRKKDRL
jgi:hypothetical protein